MYLGERRIFNLFFNLDDEMAMEVDLEPIENDSVPVSQSFCPMNMPCDSNVNFNKTVLQNQYDSTTFFTSEVSPSFFIIFNIHF